MRLVGSPGGGRAECPAGRLGASVCMSQLACTPCAPGAGCSSPGRGRARCALWFRGRSRSTATTEVEGARECASDLP